MSHMIDQRLKELRKQLGVSQGQVAEYAHVSQSTLSDLERGKIAPKSLDVLYNISKHYEVSLDWLFGLSNDPTPRPVDNKKPLDPEIEELLASAIRLSANARWVLFQLCRLMLLSEESQKTQEARQLLEDVNELLDKDLE